MNFLYELTVGPSLPTPVNGNRHVILFQLNIKLMIISVVTPEIVPLEDNLGVRKRLTNLPKTTK